jgi:hypothetical protein
VKVYDLAHARAGDKGDVSNIAVVSRSKEGYVLLARVLTADRVKAYFGEQVAGDVVRFDLPQLLAFNFVMQGALRGGVTQSTALDAHGKSMSSALLELDLEVEHAAAGVDNLDH